MQFNVTLIILSLFGLSDAGYLWHERVKKKPLVCPIGHTCDDVVNSSWSTMFGIRNEILIVC